MLIITTGGWVPTADQAYERTGRANVLRAQAGVAEFIKSHPRRGDPFDEGLVFSALAGIMATWGFPEGVIDDGVQRGARQQKG